MPENTIPQGTGRVLDAYRQTPAPVRDALALDDGQWLQVGALLDNAALLPADHREAHRAAVTAIVRARLGPARWAEGHRMDPERPLNDETLAARFRTWCEIVEDAGALALSDAMLVAWLASDPTIDALERARVEAVRARIASKAGDLDVATERYRRVARAARREGSDELRVRALLGEAIVARHRGNYPRSRQLATRAAALAERGGMRRLTALAYHTLLVADAVAGNFAAALAHGWRAYLEAEGNQTMECEILGNIGQLFLDAGHPVPAVAAFRALLAREPADRILVPALGGLAVAASRTGERRVVEWVQEVVSVREQAGATAYDVAVAQLDLARAWSALHVPEQVERARQRALALATRHRFHEIAHHAETLPAVTAPAPLPLPASAEEVADAVLQLVGA